MSFKPATTRFIFGTALLALLLILLLNAPAPWSPPRTLAGKVIRSDVVLGSKFRGGSEGFILVHLADGTVVSLHTSRSSLPPVSTLVTVEERHGVFGQRLVTLVGRHGTPP